MGVRARLGLRGLEWTHPGVHGSRARSLDRPRLRGV